MNFLFNGSVVDVIDQRRLSSGQYEVVYLDQFNDRQTYLCDTADEIDQDFIPTDMPFVTKKKFKMPEENVLSNLVYYIGKKRIETVEKNIPVKLAHALKNSKYKNNPTYLMGKFKVEPIKKITSLREKKEEGMIPHYTDPNKGNLGYNWKAVPDKAKKKIEGTNMLKKSEIGIGESDPVKKFKEWNGHYWERKPNHEKDNKHTMTLKEDTVHREISAHENDAILKFRAWAAEVNGE